METGITLASAPLHSAQLPSRASAGPARSAALLPDGGVILPRQIPPPSCSAPRPLASTPVLGHLPRGALRGRPRRDPLLARRHRPARAVRSSNRPSGCSRGAVRLRNGRAWTGAKIPAARGLEGQGAGRSPARSAPCRAGARSGGGAGRRRPAKSTRPGLFQRHSRFLHSEGAKKSVHAHLIGVVMALSRC